MAGGLIKPETLQVYNKATISHVWIQLLSLGLGIGGILLLFPQTFKLGGVLLLLHSLTTIICFVIIKDWKGGFFEFIFMQIPVFLLWVDYPLSVLEKLKSYLE
jgi:hypothetical protein